MNQQPIDQAKLKPEMAVSVKDLVTFVMRSGSIDSRITGTNRALEGARIHRMLQAEAEQGYHPEVTLKQTIDAENAVYHISGRADGIILDMTGVTIDEIKTVSRDVYDLTEEDYPEYWAQAKCYAAIYSEQQGLSEITVRLTYYQITSKKIRYMHHRYSQGELTAFMRKIIDTYDRFTGLIQNRIIQRDEGLGAMTFPFARPRKGQRQMISAVHQTVTNGKLLLCEAPTGIGKTMAVLFGGLKALEQTDAEQIYYATAKTTQKTNAEKALSRLISRGTELLTVSVTAKDDICPLEKRQCNPKACPRAKDYFSRVNDPLCAAVAASGVFDRTRIESIADTHNLCPFEFAAELAGYADVVIGDYNYLFDPVIAEGTLSGERPPRILLIDEAHNLVDRVRAMYTVSLRRSAFNGVKKKVPAKAKALRRAISAVTAVLKETADSREESRWVTAENHFGLVDALTRFIRECDTLFSEGIDTPEELTELYFNARRYLTVNAYFDDAFVITVDAAGRDIVITEKLLDPQNAISRVTQNAYGGVLFSATLTPKNYYKRLFGLGAGDVHLTLSSPFDQDHLKLLVAGKIDTTYKKRNESIGPIADIIAAAISGKTGHYAVYFPSYAYMRAVAEEFQQRFPKVPVIIQTPGMTEGEKTAFFSAFTGNPDSLLAAFCVLGGIFSEGIDLAGEALIGAVIVGVGLPKIGDAQNLIRGYHDAMGENGFDFAYRFPGMTKILQAMGRVIRDNNDRGVVLLVDKRYTRRDYRSLLPAYYQDLTFVESAGEVEAIVSEFWNENEESLTIHDE